MSRAEVKKNSKYRAKRILADGHSFASLAEYVRYTQLKLLERAGELKNLVLQPRYVFKVNNITIGAYVADFSYTDTRSGRVVVEDVKGYTSPNSVPWKLFQYKRKLLKALYNIEVQIIKPTRGKSSWRNHEPQSKN